MKTRRAVQFRRRIRLCLGWALILSVAVGELWMVGQFVGEWQGTSVSPRQGVPPMVETVLAIR
jgi:hypothetical protein